MSPPDTAHFMQKPRHFEGVKFIPGKGYLPDHEELPMAVSIKKYNEVRLALEQVESALFRCELIDWEELEELFQEMNPRAVIRPRITIEQILGLKKALDEANRIVDDESYGPLK